MNTAEELFNFARENQIDNANSIHYGTVSQDGRFAIATEWELGKPRRAVLLDGDNGPILLDSVAAARAHIRAMRDAEAMASASSEAIGPIRLLTFTGTISLSPGQMVHTNALGRVLVIRSGKESYRDMQREYRDDQPMHVVERREFSDLSHLQGFKTHVLVIQVPQ